jgi:hypothetical protein
MEQWFPGSPDLPIENFSQKLSGSAPGHFAVGARLLAQALTAMLNACSTAFSAWEFGAVLLLARTTAMLTMHFRPQLESSCSPDLHKTRHCGIRAAMFARFA